MRRCSHPPSDTASSTRVAYRTTDTSAAGGWERETGAEFRVLPIIIGLTDASCDTRPAVLSARRIALCREGTVMATHGNPANAALRVLRAVRRGDIAARRPTPAPPARRSPRAAARAH